MTRKGKRNKKGLRTGRIMFLVIFILLVIGGIKAYPVVLDKIVIMLDKEAPIIEGAVNQEIIEGESISYKKGVVVSDNVDEDIELIVDSSKVNIKKPGVYEVVYSAVDTAGNRTDITKRIVVKEKPEEIPEKSSEEKELEELVNQVLESILKEDMSEKEKAKAIYKWARYKIGYVNDSDKSDPIKAAIRGIKKRNGDCYIYFATVKALLDGANILNVDIVKTTGTHFWSMMKIDGKWYHIDATPRKGDKTEIFMFTDEQLSKYSKKHKNSHVWDRDRAPSSPEN
ncbi:MAG TPA: hypothetical protein GXZ78_08625 [Eubacteriaceae bacterium]|nr:hypothetical protein [Eubacteriaceae bacterium]